MLPNMLAKKSGYPIALYLDAKTNTLVEVRARLTCFAVALTTRAPFFY